MAKKKFQPILGDLSRLTEEQRAEYVQAACDFLQVPSDLGLVGLSLMDAGDGARQLLLYVKKGATDIIRDRRKIDVDTLDEVNGKGYVGWKVKGHDADGRHEMAIGTVSIEGLSGQSVANAVMTAQTKAMRRMTLQFAGGGFLDELEVHEKTTNIATAASTLQQIAQPVVAPTSTAGKDITRTPEEIAKMRETGFYPEHATITISPKSEPSSSAAEAAPFAGGSPLEEKARKPRKKRTVTLDTAEQVAAATEPGLTSVCTKLAMAGKPSPSEHLEAQLEPRPEPKSKSISLTPQTVIEVSKPAEGTPLIEAVIPTEEKPFVGTHPTKEQGENFRSRLSTLVGDTLSKAGFRQSQGRSKHSKIGAFVQAMFPKADPKNLSVEQQTYFLDWIDKKLQTVGAAELVKIINKQIGEETDA